jgi:selenide,water dikinase
MPIVDDPHDFGRIAATNAISDVYAMGGSPLMALAIVGMPIDKIPLDIVRDILAGGAAACAEAGIPVAGGHSIDSPEPIYGLAVIGRCRRENLRKNSTARAGDALILTKPLGVGVYSAAFKKGALPDEAYAEMIETTTRLNKIGALLGHDPKTHAMTDVTGFGLLGHALEIARGSSLRVRLDLSALPFLSHAESLVRAGFVTGASKRNWESYGESVNFEDEPPLWRRQLLTDPQTSGGLLIACAADEASRLAEEIRAADCPGASIVGQTEAGNPEIIVG